MLLLSKLYLILFFLLIEPMNDDFISKSTDGMTLVASSSAKIGQEYLFENEYYLIVNDSLLRELVLSQADLSKVITTRVQNMIYLFYKSTLVNPKIESWDVSNVKNMSWIFGLAPVINPDLSYWDTGSVVDFSDMFNGAKNFKGDLSKWNTSSGEYFNGMFFETDFNGYLNDWDMSAAKNLSGMFDDAMFFNQPLNKWNTSNVEDMGGMFAEALDFNQDISMWDVKNVKIMTNMFRNALKFDHDLTNWETPFILVEPENFSTNSPVIAPKWYNSQEKVAQWRVFLIMGLMLALCLLASVIKFKKHKKNLTNSKLPYQDLIEFAQKKENGWISKSELDKFLGLSNKNLEMQKKIRANFIKEFNALGIGSIERIKSEDDARSYNYIIR